MPNLQRPKSFQFLELTIFHLFYTVFENHRKSRIQHCERSELRLHFEWTKSSSKMLKMVNFDEFFENATFLVIFKQCGDLFHERSSDYFRAISCFDAFASLP